MIQISHMIYFMHKYSPIWIYFTDPELPLKLRNLLFEKWNKKCFQEYYKKSGIPFTVGYDPEIDVWAIAICHPKDTFSLEIGENIVKGRIKRMRGEILKADGTIRPPYNPLPKYLCVGEC